MSTFTSDPGTRLGGRYRLEDRLAAAGGWSAWKAIDEILARPVSVITFAPGFPRLQQVVTAARAASRLTDTRLTQIFDVEDSWEHAYIVLEWPVGDTLTDLLVTGPVEPLTGARIVAEAASALAGAHAAGLAHLCLRPDSVRWTTGGGVKVTGLGIDAALSGIGSEDPALADTQGLGELLYAALTGQWPGFDYPGLPAAQLSDGQLRRPRQVRAGVPTVLDEIAGRALALPGRDGQAPFTSPAQLAGTLAAAIPPIQVPPASAARREPSRDADRLAQQRQQGQRQQGQRQQEQAPPRGWQDDERQRGQRQQGGGDRDYQPGSPGRRSGVGKLAALTLAVVIAVVGATAAVHLLSKGQHGAPSGSASSPGSSPSAQAGPLTPASAAGFDALNPHDVGNENTRQAANILSGNPAGWSTQDYSSATFGSLKAGSGLILDMSKPVQVSSVTVKFGSRPGATVEILVGTSPDRTAQNLKSMKVAAPPTAVAGSHTFTVTGKVSGQYIVIWFTSLPPDPSNPKYPYAAQVYGVSVRGTG
jgi:hypothetical protein